MKLWPGIPIRIYWDDQVTHDQQMVIREAFFELIKGISAGNTQIYYHGNWRSSSYKSAEGNLVQHQSIEWLLDYCWEPIRKQIDADKLTVLLLQFPKSLNTPRKTIVFTNRDLYLEGSNFVIGAARTDIGAVISLAKLEAIIDPYIKKEAQKTEIFHEVGHVLGLPTSRRGEKKLHRFLGDHCIETGCSMKQGEEVPEDWIEITRDRINSGSKPYCDICFEDLINIFT